MQHYDHRQRLPGVTSGNVELVRTGPRRTGVDAGGEVSGFLVTRVGRIAVSSPAIDGSVGSWRLTKGALDACSGFEKPTSTRESSRLEESQAQQSVVGRHGSFRKGWQTC